MSRDSIRVGGLTLRASERYKWAECSQGIPARVIVAAAVCSSWGFPAFGPRVDVLNQQHRAQQNVTEAREAKAPRAFLIYGEHTLSHVSEAARPTCRGCRRRSGRGIEAVVAAGGRGRSHRRRAGRV